MMQNENEKTLLQYMYCNNVVVVLSIAILRHLRVRVRIYVQAKG